jgi:ribonucleoside-diphosphate reductase beta chain
MSNNNQQIIRASEELINFDNFTTDIRKVKMFFGKYDGIQRFDRFKYPISDKLAKVQQSSIWFPKEINFTKDMVGITTIPTTHEKIYRNNLLFQTLADSLANRFLDNVLTEYITSPEWERVIKWQAIFENIHSEAYSENVRKVYSDAEKFFNEGFQNKEIQHRLDLELKSYQSLGERLRNDDNEEERQRAILEVLLRQYALESIRFFISFLFTFKINELNQQVLQGSVNNIALILNDEIIHTTIFKTMINILKKEKDEGFVKTANSEWFGEMANKIFSEVIESEIKWFDYQSSIEELPGLTREVAMEFLEFYSNRSLDLIDVKNNFKSVKNEAVLFFEDKKDINNAKAQAQETNLLSYNIGVLEDKGYWVNHLGSKDGVFASFDKFRQH